MVLQHTKNEFIEATTIKGCFETTLIMFHKEFRHRSTDVANP